ncbi:hypothetical protein KDN34_13605 [Shewanella yunxiaonensis]|uniref:DUF2846 domain-containing protein n=1 Tax=Shewanella yunxiaonensis TaxID=2829809 RepID=A0ABX7YSB0_9GAMM|nr:hypothetical protein [Shewanella yunxiaonensis]QUN05224.1 hypothetical protein KDN34_13605 [Shewanella yunxiaonensis]
MNKIKLVLMFCCLLVAGCASVPMTATNQVDVNPAPSDKAQVVFMRDSFVGSAISSSVYDVSDGEPMFIGILDNGTKLAYLVNPGQHVFMVVSEAADFMEAQLAAGKTYYSIITPRMGLWKARFSMWPVKAGAYAEYKLDSKDFADWKRSTKLVELSPAAQAWYDANKTSVKAKQQEYWLQWQQKSAADISKRTLSPEDGR